MTANQRQGVSWVDIATLFQTLLHLPRSSVRGVERVWRRRDTELRLASVIYGVESLQEGEAVDEVEARARRGSDVGHDKVDGVGVAADRRVELLKALSQQCEELMKGR